LLIFVCVVCRGLGLGVEGAGLQAAAQDPDASVGEPAEGGMLAGSADA
jgi:hypothetical protein